MALVPGTRLGPYEVLAPLGAGGMGEVYRARDTRLERTVAIKILPEALAGDPQFRERFDREARAISQLDHPHICALYDVGDENGMAFLVMQHLEGETLADRLANGALPLDQALRVGIEIAGALTAAHRAGIVHRDLKPGNVMLTKTGAKLLDFGLAKSAEPAVAGSLSMLPTTPPNLTQQGTILGTFQYMAPEQLEGQEADARTDIFAFGAVLYEMLTGRRAFAGKSQASLIGAILKDEPAPPSTVQPITPKALDRIVATCFAKDPADRWQTATDVERQLAWIASDSNAGTASAAFVASVHRHRARMRLFTVAAATAAAAAIGAGAALWWGGAAAESALPTRVSVVLPNNRPLAMGWSPGRSLAISPDGTRVVYVGTNLDIPAGEGNRTLLYLRSLDNRIVQALPGTIGARQPFFSPDGEWVAFFTTTGELKKLSLAGGNPITLLSKINGSLWGFGTWLEDGTIVFGSTLATEGLRRVPADGGEAVALTTLDPAQMEGHYYPVRVPETRAVLFAVRHNDLRSPRIDAVMVDTGERRVVVENGDTPVVLDSGHLLFRRANAMLIAPFDRERLALSGPPVSMGDDVRPDSAGSNTQVPEMAVSPGGTLAYVPAVDTPSALGLVGRDGSFERLGSPLSSFDRPRVSPDGRYIGFVVPRGGNAEVHVHDLVRGSTTKLTQEGSDYGLAWHPGSRSLALTSMKSATAGIFLKNLDGREEILVSPPSGVGYLRNASWSADGTLLAYTAQTGNQHDIWVLAMGANREPKAFLQSVASEHSPTFSPNGRWLAYASDESGRYEIYMRRYPEGEQLTVSTAGGNGPVWRADGREIYFQGLHDGEPQLMVVSVSPDGDSLRLGRPAPLFKMRVTTSTGDIEQYAASSNFGPAYDVLPDGRFVMVRGADPQGTREIVLVQHWFEELKRLVPVN